MRFKLVEAPSDKKVKPEWPPSMQTLRKFNQMTISDDKVALIEEKILPHPQFKHLYGIRELMIECMLSYGINPQRNLFLDFLSKLTVSIPNRDERPKIQYIYDSYKNKRLDVRDSEIGQVLNNPSLYSRNLAEFKYTVNAFNLMLNPKKASAYIKDTSVVDIGMFFKNGSNLATSEIKPAGTNGQKGDTIFNVIESWAKDNEYSPEEIASNKKREKEEEESKSNDKKNGPKYVLEDVIPREDWDYEVFKKNIEMAFKHKTDLKINSTKEECLEKAYIAFEYPKLVETSTLTAVQGTKNKISNKTAETITEADVKTFGDPTNKPDEPIHIKVLSDGKTKDGVSGVFVFHKFVPLSKDNINNLKQLSAKYVRDMEVKTFVASNDRTLDKLQGLITILEQVG